MGSELPLIAAGGMALVILASILGGWIARGKAERHTALKLEIEAERVVQLTRKLEAFKAGGDLMVDAARGEADAAGLLAADPAAAIDGLLHSAPSGSIHRFAPGEADEPDRRTEEAEEELEP